MGMTQPTGDSITRTFGANDAVARFVVSMSMAKNDLERALRDVMCAGEKDAPDLFYRVRLVMGHLVEALDSLNAYSSEFKDVRRLLLRVSKEGQGSLKIARGTMQKVGAEALQHARDNTFHYPSPRTNYSPTSDEHLRHVLAGMGARRAEVHVDFDTKHVTLTFADEVALAMSMGKHAPQPDDLARQVGLTRDGALAFVEWSACLLVAYVEASGAEFGKPEMSRMS